jgi:translation initiation factor 5B
MGIKIAGNELQKAVAGTSLMVLHPDDDVEDLKDEVMKDLEAVMGSLARQAKGVFVQASTLGTAQLVLCQFAGCWLVFNRLVSPFLLMCFSPSGSLEALMEYLRTHDPPVPVAGVALGPIHKRDVVAASAMLEHKKE